MKVGGPAKMTYRERNRRHSPPEELAVGVEQFNAGNYLQCCNTLEFISLHEPRIERNLYQGIIQLAMALSNRQEGDFRGALRLLRTGIQLLRHVTPVCQQVDVAGFIAQAGQLRERLEELGMEKMHQIPAESVPRIRMMNER